jgi:uncharacterized cupredoxin-like copper-binding protein
MEVDSSMIAGRIEMSKKTTLVAASAALVLLLAACGGGGEDPVRNDQVPADGIRTIEVVALDELSFDPGTVKVEAGETIRFIVTNAGSAVHDFYVGTEDEQMAHEAEMGDTGMGMDHGADPEADALTLEAGETDGLTVTFDEPGTVLFACHQPGHYDGGMIGTINVT